ncbi:MAG: S9 family peptidase [Gemmatimonadota bacterium]|nr:S9 family peptidase [Gemmatimonadota bacterium]
MRARLGFVRLALCGGLLAPAAAHGQARPTPVDALALRRIEDLVWSPNGRTLAFTVVSADTTRRRWSGDIWIADSAGARVLVEGSAHEHQPRWSFDGARIAFLSDRDTSAQIWVVAANGGEPRQVTRAPGGVTAFDWMPDGTGLAFTAEAGSTNDSSHRRPPASDPQVVGARDREPHLWHVTLETGSVKEWAHLDGALSNPRTRPGTTDVLVERRPSSRADDEDRSDLALIRWDGRVVSLTENNKGPDHDASWSADGEAYVWLSGGANLNGSDVSIAPPGSPAHTIPALSGFDARSPQLVVSGPDGKRLTASAIVGRGTTARVWTFGPDGARAWTEDSVVVSAAAWSPDLRTLATVESSPTRAPELYLRRDGRPRQRVTQLNALSYAIGATRVVHWKGADGLALDGILVTPPGYSGGRKPLIVRVHGGPYGGFTVAFDPFAQLLAGRGYAVFEPNFRGSSGHGEPFAQMIRADYGGKNATDILTGVDALVASGVADSTRMGIYGWSFGGYSTDWMLTQSRRFLAGVAGAGMSDLVSHYGTSDIQRYREHMSNGAPWDSAAATYLWNRSPIRLANRVHTPLLLLHGEQDRRVAISQSEEMYTSLRRLGVEVQMVRYPREPHGFVEPGHQVDRDRRIVEWFDRYLMGGVTP